MSQVNTTKSTQVSLVGLYFYFEVNFFFFYINTFLKKYVATTIKNRYYA
jgi:hypothetical protein